MKNLFFPTQVTVVSVLVTLVSSGASAAPAPSSCATTREFVTTLEFLRAQKRLAVPEAQAQAAAKKVAQGCSGAARRFIKVFETLSRAGLGANDSFQVAVELAGKTDREVETFVEVFKRAYLREQLDLDLQSSVQLAKSLSTEFEGDVLAVRDDFETIVSYCVNERKLDLPRPGCAELAVRVARAGQPFSGGVARSFIDVLEFLRSKKGPALPISDALRLAEETVAYGPGAGENFVQAYRYSISRSGLKTDQTEALAFAKEMAALTPEKASAVK